MRLQQCRWLHFFLLPPSSGFQQSQCIEDTGKTTKFRYNSVVSSYTKTIFDTIFVIELAFAKQQRSLYSNQISPFAHILDRYLWTQIDNMYAKIQSKGRWKLSKQKPVNDDEIRCSQHINGSLSYIELKIQELT